MLLRYHNFSNGILGILIYLFHLGRSLKNSGGVDLASCIRSLSRTAISASLLQWNRPTPKRPVDSSKSVPHSYGVPIRRWRSWQTGAIIVTDNRSTIFEIPARISLIPFIQITLLLLLIGCEFRWREDASPTKPCHTTTFFGGPGSPRRCTAHHLIPWTASDRLLHQLLHFTVTAIVTATERWNA
jgi:hypothetical protein